MLSNLNSKVKYFRRRFFEFWQENEKEIILAIGVSLAVFIAFGSGILIGNNKPKEPLTIEEPAIAEEISSLRENLKIFNDSPAPAIKNIGDPSINSGQDNFVASKNGEYYYPLDCAAANRIKDANKIFFETKEAAERKGLKPSAYCKF